MGKIMKFHCDQCGYETELFVGAGRGSINTSMIESTLEGDDLKQWKDWMSSGEIVHTYSENKLCMCAHCQQLQTMYQVTCSDKSGENRLIQPRCKVCNESTDVINKWEQQDIPCPKCKNILQKQMTGLWD